MADSMGLAELARPETEEVRTMQERVPLHALVPDFKTNVLIVGSGAREHAFMWSFAQSRIAGKIYVAPGNGGTNGHNVDIPVHEVERLYEFARQHNCLTVPGQELPLALGIVDYFRERGGLAIFGPTQQQAKLEWSKEYSKRFMKDNGIPTSDFAAFTDSQEAIMYASSRGWNVAVKADGLADGKGVFMCSSEQEAIKAITDILDRKMFNGANRSIVIEDRLEGSELSVFALCDGRSAVYIGSAVDHKQLLDGGNGPNTGGMGAYSPARQATPFLIDIIMKNVADVVVKKTGYTGFLYMGMMLTEEGIKVLEFNARFGDPEAQVILPRLKFDLLDEIYSISRGNATTLSNGNIFNWKHACAVSMCSEGYPFGHADKLGREIVPLDVPVLNPEAVVFHAGTRMEDGKLLTDGGRVLSVTGLGSSLEAARRNAYREVARIHFEGEQHRTDIGMTERRPSRTKH